MLNFKCYCCKKELNQPGALLFSPPLPELANIFDNEDAINKTVEENDVRKYHICPDCFNDIIRNIHLYKENVEYLQQCKKEGVDPF